MEKKIRSSRTVVGKILLEIKTGQSSSCKELLILWITEWVQKYQSVVCFLVCDTTGIIRMCMLCHCCICLYNIPALATLLL